MIEIDGSQGEGGGQIVRSSLALSLLTGKPLTICNIRAGRSKPGLMRQHLTALNAAVEVGGAKVTGADVGSREISFEPTEIRQGDFNFFISTAGSITLVLQTVLPALMIGNEESKISLSGGTHNMMAPPFDFLARSYVPQLEKMGPHIGLELNSWGFYPAGGGKFVANIQPVESMASLNLNERGKLLTRRVRAVVSSLPVKIAQRETDRIARKLNWDRVEFEHIEVENPHGPGNIVFAELVYENVTVVFTGFGRVGVTSEKVADGVVRAVRKYLKLDAPVGPHLADQLMLPMAIAAHFSNTASQFRTGPLTKHSITHANIIKKFLDVDVAFKNDDPDNSRSAVTVTMSPVS